MGTLEACQMLFLEWTGTLCETQLDVLILEARALLSTVHTRMPKKKTTTKKNNHPLPVRQRIPERETAGLRKRYE